MAIGYDTMAIIVTNMGAVIYIAVKVVDKVDKHQEILPKLIEAVENINNSAKQHIEAITDLYDKHNNLSDKFHELFGEHKANMEAGRRVHDVAYQPKQRITDPQRSED